MTTIYLARHGEAEGNLYRRIHGHTDGLLTERGERQAEALRRRFAALPVEAVWSSDLRRAAATARAAAEPHGLPIRTTAALREVSMGAWEDKTWGEVQEEQAEAYRLYLSSPDRWHVPGSEDWEALKARMLSALSEIARAHEGQTVAVFSHGCAIRALVSAILGVPGSEISRIPYCGNTALSCLKWENGAFSVAFYNDQSHLSPALTAPRQHFGEGEPLRNLRLAPFDVIREKERYLRRYEEAWVLSHGSAKGFSTIYHDKAVMRSLADPRSVMEADLNGVPAGMIELAPDSGAEENRGHIAFLCMDPAFRGRGLAVQLIGHAVFYYRALGREALRLRVNERNDRAVRFYSAFGFRAVKREKGIVGHVLIMEKRIAP